MWLEPASDDFPSAPPVVPLVSPGHDCPTCKRRVPHPRKPSSPQSKVASIRIPIDDVETFEEQLKAAAEAHGLHDKPHWKYWTVLHGLVLLLQEPASGQEG
jgi:hypothetical protein